jgi:internalin A
MSDLALLLINDNKRTKASFLDLGNCGLVNELPNELLDCIWLEELNLGKSFYSDKNKSIQSVNKEAKNSLECHSLDILKELPKLRALYLGGNTISNVDFLENLTNLQILQLQSNKITDTRSLEKMVNLQLLNLMNNQIADTGFLEKLANLQSLNLSSCGITDTSFLTQLKNLQELYLYDNDISDCSSLRNLTNLQILDLNSNAVLDTGFLVNLTNLQDLNLNNNKISDCSSLSKLTNLQGLNLSMNEISDCSFVEKLVNLSGLQLGSNEISDISFLENLTNLQVLRLQYNNISDIDYVKKMCFFLHLEVISFMRNPLPLPPEILGDLTQLRSYFIDSEKGITEKRTVKLLFLGDGCAGKSTLYQHLKTGTTPPLIEINNRTHGIELDNWAGEIPNIDVKVWDFGGQEVFHSTHRLFLGQRAVYVLVYTKQANKKCAKDEQHPLRYWLNFIAEYGRDSTVLLVENLIDGELDETQIPDENSLTKLVDEYKEKGIRLNRTIHKIDCRNSTREVKTFKAILQSEIRQLVDDYPINKFPANWYDLQKKLEYLRVQHKTIDRTTYETIATDLDVNNAIDLLPYFDKSGIISYYPDLFKDQIILQTDWVLEAMYAFLKLENNPLENRDGKIQEDDFAVVWSLKYTTSEQQLFRSYMLKSELIAEINNSVRYGQWPIKRKYQYLIPSLFPTCSPDQKTLWNEKDKYWAIQFKFTYPAIMQRLQVRVLTYCHVNHRESFYRNQISFTDSNNKIARIEALENEKEIRIWSDSADLYQKILNELNRIYPLERLTITERKKEKMDKTIDFKAIDNPENGFDLFDDEKIPIIESDAKIKVFVTYCWVNANEKIDEDHQTNVRHFVDNLIGYNFDATFDLYENENSTATDFITMMYKNIVTSDKVIIVLSEGYAKRAEEFLVNGVSIEYQAIMNDISKQEKKYILIKFSKENENTEIYPFGLEGRDTVLINNGNLELSENEENIQRLFSKLRDKPIYVKPPFGNKKPIVYQK